MRNTGVVFIKIANTNIIILTLAVVVNRVIRINPIIVININKIKSFSCVRYKGWTHVTSLTSMVCSENGHRTRMNSGSGFIQRHHDSYWALDRMVARTQRGSGFWHGPRLRRRCCTEVFYYCSTVGSDHLWGRVVETGPAHQQCTIPEWFPLTAGKPGGLGRGRWSHWGDQISGRMLTHEYYSNNSEIRWRIEFAYKQIRTRALSLSKVIQRRHFSLLGHIARMPESSDTCSLLVAEVPID